MHVLLEGAATFASLSDIISYLGTVGTWFWSLFTGFYGIIISNSVLLWLVLAGTVFFAIGLVIKVLKKFGLRGRRS